MVATEETVREILTRSSSLNSGKHFRVIDKTFKNNTDSDYTEQLKSLRQQFDYASNSNDYWGPAELSLLYGTPLYDEASKSQKLALNHLYWVGNYNHTAVSEATTSIYNQVTAGVFRRVGGYETLCDAIELETQQESEHIRTFQKIGCKSKMAIVGKTILGNAEYSKQNKRPHLIPRSLRFFDPQRDSLAVYRDLTLKAIAKFLLKDNRQYYSGYLEELEAQGKSIPAPTDGLGGRIAPRHWLRFFTIHWGMSPFMACQYYSLRYTANAILKNQEYPYVRYYRQLSQQGKDIPIPTAVSFYHLLDEAFHTTMSQTIARDMYRDFPEPTAYEKFISGLIIYRMQRHLLGGLSGVFPGRCVHDDSTLMLFYFKLLKSPLFGMDAKEALHWLEKCFCTEHQGFQVGLKYHQSLRELMLRLFSRLDYQWQVNREMSIMAAGGSIDKALQNNIKTWKSFSRSLEN